MTSSQDKGHFFQSTHALNESSRKATKSKNDNGSPIRLPSKILSVIGDPDTANAVYVAESAGNARRVDLESRESTHVYRGPAAPITSLAVSEKRQILYAGCWDKSIWSWNCQSCQPGQRFFGHTDFVKVVLHHYMGDREVLVSGGADAKIIIWEARTAEKLHVLKGANRGILCLEIDPLSLGLSEGSTDLVIFSGSSDPDIRRWRLSHDWVVAREIEPDKPIQQHETSVNNISFDQDGDLWTASSDGTVKCLARDSNWQADIILEHGDYVRDVVLDTSGRFVATAGRSEDVKVWERATGDLVCTYEGHFEEITKLALISDARLVSVSIDATIRSWALKADEFSKLWTSTESAGETRQEVAQSGILTEAEEKELAELMESD